MGTEICEVHSTLWLYSSVKHLSGSAAVSKCIGSEYLEDKAKVLAYSLNTLGKKKKITGGQTNEITSN